MGTVIVNGKFYDSRTGLPADIAMAIAAEQPKAAVAVEQESAEVSDKATSESARKVSIQDGDIKDHKKSATPAWISSYVSVKQDKAAPSWISNYLAGNDPVEIEPIGLGRNEETTDTERKRDLERAKPLHAHRAPSRARTLNRSFVKKPVVSDASASVKVRATRPIAMVEKHPEVYRFSPMLSTTEILAHSKPAPQKAEKPVEKISTATFKPISQSKKAVDIARPTSSQIKDVLIKEQLDQPIADKKSRRQAEKQVIRQARRRRFFRAPTVITATLAIVVLGGYFTYVNLPAISIRVAANNAGIDAHIPYTPSGYSIDGPVASASGQIKINYKSNGGATGYSITQQESDWTNSDIENSLIPLTANYKTMSSSGVTVYRYGQSAAWIKNKMLFTVDGNDLMGDEQIMKIAESV